MNFAIVTSETWIFKTKILVKNNQCWVHNYFIHWSQKKVSNVFSMLVYLIQKMCNYQTLLAKANMAKVQLYYITYIIYNFYYHHNTVSFKIGNNFLVYAGQLISSNSKIAAKEINLPLRNNSGKQIFYFGIKFEASSPSTFFNRNNYF